MQNTPKRYKRDPVYASKIGVNTKELLISQPNSGEKGLEIVDRLVRSNEVDVIVVDSVAALTPQAEIDGEMSDTHITSKTNEPGYEKTCSNSCKIKIHLYLQIKYANRNTFW